MSLAGYSPSTLQNYGHHLAKIAIHFNRIPTQLPTTAIDGYLHELQKQQNNLSGTYFKFAVFGLRFAYKMEGLTTKNISLPVIRREKRLPVVLSRQEIKRLLSVSRLHKHRVVLLLLYGCGLRCSGVLNLELQYADL